jgi:hypothetical protein
MLGIDILFAAVVFFGVYYITQKNNTQRKEVARADKSQRLEQLLTSYRTQGPNMKVMQDQTAELIRRGKAPDEIPQLGVNGVDSIQELAAELQLGMEDTPYVPRDLGEPGEDSTIANSGFQLWPRPLEEDAGEN